MGDHAHGARAKAGGKASLYTALLLHARDSAARVGRGVGRGVGCARIVHAGRSAGLVVPIQEQQRQGHDDEKHEHVPP